MRAAVVLLALIGLLTTVNAARAQTALSGERITIGRATGKIAIDGDLSDEGWKGATRVARWYETNPADNAEPKVRNVGYLAYDDHSLYAGFEFDDPNPSAIRAPLGDRDNVPGFTDYGGVIIDTRNDGRTAAMFLSNPRGIQYDAITDDASGEDPSPDFFWESAARITDHGWTLELRIPFSSLRYRTADPQTWGILLYRNYPRDRRYQFFSARLPRGGNCFVCRANTLAGLSHLPAGGHLIVAPYLTATEAAEPVGDLGTALENGAVKTRGGVDVKFTPNADNAIDVTIRPDFSQVESDTAQISANERFALLFPEKRPFFLEDVNLFSTPIQALYTRTITAPRWGARVTGQEGGVVYTALAVEDAGGGSVIIPGPNGSESAPQDFSSTVFVARARQRIGRSSAGIMLADRESGENGHNRVFGPDFEWRPSPAETITGALLVADTKNPNRPDLYSGWTGQSFTDHAAKMLWTHNTTHLDLTGVYNDVGNGFRADTGFVPQVGYREEYGEAGYTVRPSGFASRVRTFLQFDRQTMRDGAPLYRLVSPGFGMDTKLSGFMRFRYANDQVRSGDRMFPRQQFVYTAQISPSRTVSQLTLDGSVGQDVDFDNSRAGRGATVNLGATLHPGDHFELALLENQPWLYVNDSLGASRRLLTERISRARGTYTLTARSFLRAIAQYVRTDRSRPLYTTDVVAAEGAFTGSLLFAYKLNWQSVLFVGYGDDREISGANRLEKADRQLFVKVSYALQR